MHGEELVEQRIVGECQLDAHQQRFKASYGQIKDGGQDIHDADTFVVERTDPVQHPR